MRIVFAGSPKFAVKPLESLIENGADIVAVITQPDRPTGRKRILTATLVKEAAIEHKIPVYDFEKIGDNVETVKSLGADIMITCAYGQLLPQRILDCFSDGVWNLHASLLPKFRGASPIQSAILAGETHTGITVMRTELKLDCGGILLVKRLEIGGDTYGELEERLSILAAEAAVEACEMLGSGNNQLLVQDEAAATFCKKINKQGCKIDFNLPSEEIVRKIKAFSPQPLAYAMLNGVVLNIINAKSSPLSGNAGEVIKAEKGEIIIACGEGAVSATALQLAGGKALSSSDFLNGRKIKAGDKLE